MDFPALQKTSLWPALSELGKKIFTPSGVLVWGGRAEQEVKKDSSTINATVGTAQDDDGSVSHLKSAESFMGDAFKAVPKAKIFGYAPIPGVAGLRQKWKANIVKLHPALANHICDCVVTNGITHSLYLVGQMLLNSGETIIFPEKSWENYQHTFENILNLKIRTFPLFKNNAFDPGGMTEVCEKTANDQKKVVILLNFPHNQTGYMPSHEELLKTGANLHELCKKYPAASFTIVLDDAYEGYVYDDRGQKYSPYGEIFGRHPNLTVFKLDGASKVMLAYGSRVGFITAIINNQTGDEISSENLTAISKELTSKLGGLVRGEVSQINHHGQIMVEALLDAGEEVSNQRNKVIAMLGRRWKSMISAIRECEQKYGREKLYADPVNSGFFCFLNLSREISPTALVEKLIAQERIVVFPSESDFGLRVAFCSVKEAQIPSVIEKIFRVVYEG